MVKKRYLLISSFIATIISLCIIAGSTFAAGSLENVQNFAVRAGNIEVVATAENLKMYSAEKLNGLGDTGEDVIYDENNNAYRYVECKDGEFACGGTAVQDTEKHTITLSNIVAGDKVEFYISVKNNSNIPINYSTEIQVSAETEEDKELFNGLDVVLKDNFTVRNERAAYTGLTTVKAHQKSMETVHVSISLPIDAGKELMDKSICISYVVYASTVSDGIASVGGEEYATLAQAVENAKDNDTIVVSGNINGEVVPIQKPLTIVGAEDGNTVSNTQFVISGGPVLTLKDLNVSGNSYVDASAASALEVENCNINVNPDRYYDYGSRQVLSKAAFIVSNTEQKSGLKLTFKNNEVVSANADSTAIFLGCNLANGSEISGNTFGNSGISYNSSAVSFVGAVRSARISISDNEVWGGGLLEVGQKVYSNGTNVLGTENFEVRSLNNRINASGESSLAILAGKASFLDSGTTINNIKVTVSDIKAQSMLFSGVNVTFDINQIITSGDFVLSSIDARAFKANYVAASAKDANIRIYGTDGVFETLDKAIENS